MKMITLEMIPHSAGRAWGLSAGWTERSCTQTVPAPTIRMQGSGAQELAYFGATMTLAMFRFHCLAGIRAISGQSFMQYYLCWKPVSMILKSALTARMLSRGAPDIGIAGTRLWHGVDNADLWQR
eukprot:9137989-Karenia_brevis.AAC.1